MSLGNYPMAVVDLHDVAGTQILQVDERQAGETAEQEHVPHLFQDFLSGEGEVHQFPELFLREELAFLNLGTDIELGEGILGDDPFVESCSRHCFERHLVHPH